MKKYTMKMTDKVAVKITGFTCAEFRLNCAIAQLSLSKSDGSPDAQSI